MTIQNPASDSVHEPLASITDLQTWRERASWEATARHLNQHGFAAAVPAQLVAPFRRRGLVVWAARGEAA